jgi:hypothetical protein
MIKNQKKRDLLFSLGGITMLILIILVFIYSINFLVDKISQSLQGSTIDESQIIRFNLEALKKIGLDSNLPTPSNYNTSSSPTSSNP